MTWAVPAWYPLILLSLAAFRSYRLLAWDLILDPVRDRLIPEESKRREFVTCSYCLGAWCAVGWWLAWVWQPRWSLIAAVPFALSALLGIVSGNLDRD